MASVGNQTPQQQRLLQKPDFRVVSDEVSGWLRVFEDGSVDRAWTGPPEALPLMASIPPSSTPRDGVTIHDVPGEPPLRIYVPCVSAAIAGSDSILPVLLHFPGGGFCISHPSWLIYHQFYSRLACAIPAVVVSAVLPLAPEHRLPAAIDASFAALLRLRDSSSDTTLSPLLSGVDLSRVFLIGDSSGGNLVHLVAARAGEAEDALPGFWSPLRLAGGIPLHPGFVRSTRSRSELELKSDSAFLTLDMLDKFLALALPEGSTKDHPFTCPMGAAAPPMETLRLPPFLVAVADKDLIRDTNIEYCEAMKAAGKDVEVVMNKGASHSFYLNKFAVDSDPVTAKCTDELVDAIANFIRGH